MFSLVTFTFGPSETMSGNRTLLERGLWPCKRTVLTPASTSSRMKKPLAAARSFNLRYRGRGMSIVVRTDSSFIERLFHVCHKYGAPKFKHGSACRFEKDERASAVS